MGEFVRRVKTASGATAVQIVSKTRGVRRIEEHIGSAHTDLELSLLTQAAKTRIRERITASGQTELQIDTVATKVLPNITTKNAFSRLLYDSLAGVYGRLGFDTAVNDTVFRDLVIARIIEPASKLDTIRILSNLGLEAPSNSGIHRCLNKTVQGAYREALSDACVTYRGVENLTLVLYDVTTLYFQVEKEDDYRKPGLSKERRLEPQIVIGLLVDERGFPLQVHSFEGNKAETLTLIPVLDAFRRLHPHVTVSVACDAGMLSATNLDALEQAGYGFIVGSRIAKTPYDIAEYQNKGGELKDGQIFDTTQMFGKAGARKKRRVVYQYREKRARLDLRNIMKQVEKAEKIAAGTVAVKKARFLKISDSSRRVDETLVASAKSRAGIKGYVTNLPKNEVTAEVVIDGYHQLFNVEASFRMTKTDLRARPVYHQVREKIEAHLTVVFASLAVSRLVQEATGVSIRKFVQTLEPVRDAVIAIDGVEHTIPAAIQEPVRDLLQKLDSSTAGH